MLTNIFKLVKLPARELVIALLLIACVYLSSKLLSQETKTDENQSKLVDQLREENKMLRSDLNAKDRTIVMKDSVIFACKESQIDDKQKLIDKLQSLSEFQDKARKRVNRLEQTLQ